MEPKNRVAHSKPLLPAAYVREVESSPCMRDYPSSVYELEAHTFRLAMRNWLKPRSPDSPYGIVEKPDFGFNVEAQRTYLHFSALAGDVLAVSERLYAGATADFLDTAGMSPLYLVLNNMAGFESLPVTVSGTMALARSAWVARILIEQHADVNISIDNTPLLHLACMARSWDIITLLLKHGASSIPSPLRCFTLPADKSRFAALVETTWRPTSRPARICPCWSGKLLSECHEKEIQLYPAQYVCVCGSGKRYKRCCEAVRGESRVYEYWDPSLKRIMHWYTDIAPPPNIQGMESYLASLQKVIPSRLLQPQRHGRSQLVESTTVDEWARQGHIDPAFAYALQRVEFIPRPLGRKVTRVRSEATQQMWNTIIDDYIAQGCDSRPREVIERAAKIGPGNGALFRVCDSSTCGKLEGRDIEVLRKCSKCKIAVYCSSECQLSAWKTHKPVCCSDEQVEQCLPSQTFVLPRVEGKQSFSAVIEALLRHAQLE